jgi:hypothetical protein
LFKRASVLALVIACLSSIALTTAGTVDRDESKQWLRLADPNAAPEVRMSIDVDETAPFGTSRRTAAPRGSQVALPPRGEVFEGITDRTGVTPPDPNGDAGLAHYVQTVNQPEGAKFAVFDKTGGVVAGPRSMERFWSDGICSRNGQGDPVVKYDSLDDRWVMSQLGFRAGKFGPVAPFYLCVFVSTTGDIRDGGTAYTFFISKDLFPDYPKLGVWNDAYYMTMHLYGSRGPRGQAVIALDRDKMLAGEPAEQVIFFVNPDDYGILPSDVDGPTPPPDGAPNYLVVVKDDDVRAAQDRLNLYGFHVDWSNPDQSNIQTIAQLPTPSFDSKMCKHSLICVPQRGTRMRLDVLASDPQGTFTMHPTSYRNFGTHESLVLNHTVQVGPARAGVRWYELRDPAGVPVIHQAGDIRRRHQSRWIASVSMNGFGDIAVGYSASGQKRYPSIRYSARAETDPPGRMPQGERVLVAGGASQGDSPRWGDYTSMSVDPADDCTFWYTNQYYPRGSEFWHTAIASIAMPGCS